jgi:sensor histidine kinase regulating citrate/malate metabolism
MVQPDAVKGFASTKKYHQGIGLTNIRNACEKYHGSFNAHTEDKKFITEVLIPIPDNKQVETSAD